MVFVIEHKRLSQVRINTGLEREGYISAHTFFSVLTNIPEQ